LKFYELHNHHPAVSKKIKDVVNKKATELNYKRNSQAANLRQGSSKTIGVIVRHINQSFFSEAIAGVEVYSQGCRVKTTIRGKSCDGYPSPILPMKRLLPFKSSLLPVVLFT
jgi:hypothetical protein